MSEPLTLLTVASGGGGSLVLGIMGFLYKSNARLWKEIDEFKLKCAETYVTGAAVRDLKNDMEKRFDKIEDMLRANR